MSDLGVLIMNLGGLFTGIVNVYIWVVIIAALLSFVNPDPYNPIVQILRRVTEPAYAIIRRYIKTNFNGIDIAPLILIIGLQVVTIFATFIFNSLAKLV